jgi:phosphoadenosine phosphosulfate reductase
MNEELVQTAIKLLRDNEPQDGKGYGLAFSGGKDSIVIKQLAIEAGVKFKAFYSQTTIDPPELVKYIREHHKDVEWLRNGGFFSLMISKGTPPNFRMRYCCAELKEQSIKGYRARIIGVRASESIRRAKRWSERVDDYSASDCDYIICPIVRWTDADVWDFIRSRKLPYCELYDKGFKRLGCIACPMTSVKNIKRELELYPHLIKHINKHFG